MHTRSLTKMAPMKAWMSLAGLLAVSGCMAEAPSTGTPEEESEAELTQEVSEAVTDGDNGSTACSPPFGLPFNRIYDPTMNPYACSCRVMKYVRAPSDCTYEMPHACDP